MSKPLFPPVSRSTFLPPEPTMAALRAIFLASTGIRSIEKISQADYDSLPTPRPSDVLYVITP